MKNWKHKQKSYFWNVGMDSEEADLLSIHFSMYYLHNKEESLIFKPM
jgi:hypothetical protein